MFIVDTAGPVTGKRMFERLGLAKPFKWITLGFLYEGVNAAENFLIGFLPKQIVIPCMVGKDEVQSMSPLWAPSPFSSWTMDSIKRCAFFGERKRYAVSSRAS